MCNALSHFCHSIPGDGESLVAPMEGKLVAHPKVEVALLRGKNAGKIYECLYITQLHMEEHGIHCNKTPSTP